MSRSTVWLIVDPDVFRCCLCYLFIHFLLVSFIESLFLCKEFPVTWLCCFIVRYFVAAHPGKYHFLRAVYVYLQYHNVMLGTFRACYGGCQKINHHLCVTANASSACRVRSLTYDIIDQCQHKLWSQGCEPKQILHFPKYAIILFFFLYAQCNSVKLMFCKRGTCTPWGSYFGSWRVCGKIIE